MIDVIYVPKGKLAIKIFKMIKNILFHYISGLELRNNIKLLLKKNLF